MYKTHLLLSHEKNIKTSYTNKTITPANLSFNQAPGLIWFSRFCQSANKRSDRLACEEGGNKLRKTPKHKTKQFTTPSQKQYLFDTVLLG